MLNTNDIMMFNPTIALTVDNLTKKFGDLTAVNCVSFDIYKNEIFGLLGPNGAGKTTTINMICGLLSPTEGKIKYSKFNHSDYKSLIGYCPQENIFYPKLTCLEQLMFIGRIYEVPRKELAKRASELLGLMGLNDKTNTMASKLSGGMKRRLNICLALIHNPEILILDEPEAGLDPQSRILVRDFIRKFGEEKTIILTTHNMDEADRLAKRIAIIDYGKLLLLDTPQNLKKTIGEGDVLEIVFENGNKSNIDAIADKSEKIIPHITRGANYLLYKHQNIIELIPAIKEIAESTDAVLKEIKLRENTLEDVFIHLTGRNLRQ